jgi:hypothetical protein
MKTTWDETPLTLADVCAAIAQHRVPSTTTRDGHVEVRVRDLRRLGYEDLVRRMLSMPPATYQPLDTGSLA